MIGLQGPYGIVVEVDPEGDTCTVVKDRQFKEKPLDKVVFEAFLSRGTISILEVALYEALLCKGVIPFPRGTLASHVFDDMLFLSEVHWETLSPRYYWKGISTGVDKRHALWEVITAEKSSENLLAKDDLRTGSPMESWREGLDQTHVVFLGHVYGNTTFTRPAEIRVPKGKRAETVEFFKAMGWVNAR